MPGIDASFKIKLCFLRCFLWCMPFFVSLVFFVVQWFTRSSQASGRTSSQ